MENGQDFNSGLFYFVYFLSYSQVFCDNINVREEKGGGNCRVLFNYFLKLGVGLWMFKSTRKTSLPTTDITTLIIFLWTKSYQEQQLF